MRKIVLISLALVLALGGLGVGYAAWTDTVTVSGPISTGEVSIEFTSSVSIEDPFFPPPIIPGVEALEDKEVTQHGPGFPGFTQRTGKNVAWGESLLVNSDLLQVSFHNVYPHYYNHVAFWLHNDGTIPVKIWKYVFRDGAGNILAEFDSDLDTGYVVFDLNNNGFDDFEIQWGDNYGAQLEPSDIINISFGVSLLQDEGIQGEENLTFTVEAVAIQWNEYQEP